MIEIYSFVNKKPKVGDFVMLFFGNVESGSEVCLGWDGKFQPKGYTVPWGWRYLTPEEIEEFKEN